MGEEQHISETPFRLIGAQAETAYVLIMDLKTLGWKTFNIDILEVRLQKKK